MTNVEPIDVVKKLRAYLLTLSVAPYDSLVSWIYTGPQEEIENKNAKYSVIIYYDYDDDPYEIGDSETETKIALLLRFRYRVDADAVTGEKEASDTFFQYFARRLRSQAFRSYMATTNAGIGGVKTPPFHITGAAPLEYDPRHYGHRIYLVRMELWSYISTNP